MATQTRPQAQVFSMRTPLLEQGRTTDIVAKTDLLTVTTKVYAEGGENAIHTHPTEDHAFIVLQGQATFHTELEDNVKVVNRYDGVMLPMGSLYWFQSTGDENLVMVRVGASNDPRGMASRVHPDGTPFPGEAPENNQVERIEVPGAFFE